MLGWIKEHVKDDIDFVVWTGDSARHDKDEEHPRGAQEVLGMNRRVADKIAETFSSSDGQLEIPVVPTFGNNDFLPHNIFYPGPNKWLHAYDDIWRRFIPEEQRHSFEFGGWFFVEVIPDQLAVFSLNTMYFFDRNAGVDGCALPSEPGFKHMEWLRVQLQRMRERGMKAILIGHVPPARTDSKELWDETCWQKYTIWLQQFRDVVTASLYGHMNIDHFMFQDTHDIDLSLTSASPQTPDDDMISIASKEDYLQDLVEKWSGLPDSAVKSLSEDNVDAIAKRSKGKGKKDPYKKIGGEFAERYQLSLISPSIVPNFFPTIRVFEYNITGLEKAKVWTDSFDAAAWVPPTNLDWVDEDGDRDEDGSRQELKRDLDTEKKKKKKKKHGKGDKGKKPKDPNLIIPEDPSEKNLPGPAYLNQAFTLTGYTQYYANLTYLNNDIPDDFASKGWRDGDHPVDEPQHKPARPHDFEFQVEYSTFDDKIYKLPDLTVRNYVKLAYRIGEHLTGKSNSLNREDAGDESEKRGGDVLDSAEDGLELDEEEECDGEGNVESEKKKKKKKKKKHHHGKKNKAWLAFLDRAFVRTKSKDELKKL